MKRRQYRDQDTAFGQMMLTLRTALRLTQANLATVLGVSRISVADWEAGNKYPKADNLKALIGYAAEQGMYADTQAADDIRALWKASRQKVPLDERWLASLLGAPDTASPPVPPKPTAAQPPPLRLPSQTAPFIGREQELDEIAHILLAPACRLLTLLGPGGIGKTSLALAVARSHAARFRDGAAFVPLEAVSTPAQIVSAIGGALNLSFSGQAEPPAALIRHLRDQNLLLILDNFEHLLESRGIVFDLLEGAPGITLLVTSQARLQLRVEWLYDVAGLSHPSPASDVQNALNSAAVQLFIQRATQVQPAFSPTETALTSIVRICQQVSGMPLAIELAAAGARNLPVAEIERQMRANYDLLATSFRDIPARHRSLRAAFEYSWALLTEPEQALISRLAVFRVGFTADAARVVAGAQAAALLPLVDRSLLYRNRGTDDEAAPRFFMLEPIREYALDKLNAAGEETGLRQAHAGYYLELSEAVNAQWDNGNPDSALRQLDQEHDNVRAAVQWARDSGSITLGLRLAGTLWRFWRRGGYIDEARRWLDELLALDDDSADPAALRTRLLALYGAAWLATDQGDFERAAQLFEQAWTLRGVLGDSKDDTLLVVNAALRMRAMGDYPRTIMLLEDRVARLRAWNAPTIHGGRSLAPAVYCLALVVREQGNYPYAEALYNEGIAFCRSAGDRTDTAQGELGLSDIARDHGDTAKLRAYAKASLATMREFGIEWAMGFALNNLALAALMEGHLPEAHAYSAEALALFRGIQNKGSLAEGLITQGRIQAARGEIDAARDTFTEALRFGWEVGPLLMVAGALEGLAPVALDQGDAAAGIRWIGAAAALRTRMGTPVRPVDQPALERARSAALTALGDTAYSAAWSAGQTQPLGAILAAIPNAIGQGGLWYLGDHGLP